MLRIVCREIDATAQAGAGHPHIERLKTFELHAPEIEKWLCQPYVEGQKFVYRTIIGVEQEAL